MTNCIKTGDLFAVLKILFAHAPTLIVETNTILLISTLNALFCADMSKQTLNIYAYEVFVDGEKYLAVPRLFQNAACVQISLDRSWNENDITSALVAKDGKVIEAARFIVRNDHEDNQQINCADNAVTDETRLLFQRFRRITDAVLAADPVYVAVPRSGIGFLDLPNLPKKPLALQPLAHRSEIHITGIRAAHP